MSHAAMYLAVFLGSLAVDLIPLIGPPAWIVMVFLQVKFDLNPWLVLAVGVPGSTLGRYVLSLYIPKISDTLLKRHKKEDLQFVGKKLGQKLWRSWLFVLIYSLLPLSTTALFSAAGIAKVRPIQILPPFFVGKFISDAVMLFSGQYAVHNVADILAHASSMKSIITIVLGILIVGLMLFLDWRVLLEKRRFSLTFRIWK